MTKLNQRKVNVLLKEFFSITLDVIPAGQTQPEDIVEAFPEMKLTYQGITEDKRNTFYRFTGTVYHPGNSSTSTFKLVLRADIKEHLPPHDDFQFELGDASYS
jgi:hypothetical protein